MSFEHKADKANCSNILFSFKYLSLIFLSMASSKGSTGSSSAASFAFGSFFFLSSFFAGGFFLSSFLAPPLLAGFSPSSPSAGGVSTLGGSIFISFWLKNPNLISNNFRSSFSFFSAYLSIFLISHNLKLKKLLKSKFINSL